MATHGLRRSFLSTSGAFLSHFLRRQPPTCSFPFLFLVSRCVCLPSLRVCISYWCPGVYVLPASVSYCSPRTSLDSVCIRFTDLHLSLFKVSMRVYPGFVRINLSGFNVCISYLPSCVYIFSQLTRVYVFPVSMSVFIIGLRTFKSSWFLLVSGLRALSLLTASVCLCDLVVSVFILLVSKQQIHSNMHIINEPLYVSQILQRNYAL